VPPAGGDIDADRRLGEVEDACVLDGEVVAAMADIPAAPQAAHDGDRLAQNLVAHVHGRPAGADDGSFSCSPAPSPRVKRSPESTAVVAAIWATIAGW
jgi:hypothetical protein